MNDQTVTSFQIEGLNCASCAGRAEKALIAIKGVARATVNLAAETAQVSYGAPADTHAMIKALSDAGYPRRHPGGDAPNRGHELRFLRWTSRQGYCCQ